VSDLIRWTDASDGGFFGFAGRYQPAAFKVIPPGPGEDFWMLSNYMCPLGTSRFGSAAGDMKQQAEAWLREFTSSLGALFAGGLRAWLDEQAALEQSLGDDYSDSPGETALEQAHWHWGRADAYRSVIKRIEAESRPSSTPSTRSTDLT
jgi:hypothetical protein